MCDVTKRANLSPKTLLKDPQASFMSWWPSKDRRPTPKNENCHLFSIILPLVVPNLYVHSHTWNTKKKNILRLTSKLLIKSCHVLFLCVRRKNRFFETDLFSDVGHKRWRIRLIQWFWLIFEVSKQKIILVWSNISAFLNFWHFSLS